MGLCVGVSHVTPFVAPRRLCLTTCVSKTGIIMDMELDRFHHIIGSRLGVTYYSICQDAEKRLRSGPPKLVYVYLSAI